MTLHLLRLATALNLIILSGLAAAAEPATPKGLQAQPYQRLPMGSVHADSWLKHQLELQRDGLTGHAPDLYHDILESSWVHPRKRGGQYAWERGPYYARGLVALAYTLDDEGLKKKTERWINKVLESQANGETELKADGKVMDPGDFGPRWRSWWANMVVLQYMRDAYDATQDERILSFLNNYFRYQLKTLPEWPINKNGQWAEARGGDNLDIVLWMYKKTGEAWLLELATLIVNQTGDWTGYYTKGTNTRLRYPTHIVNINQGLKSPPLMWLVTGEQRHKDGFAHAHDPNGWLWKQCGRVDGMLSGSEPITDRSSTAGTELCAIVERILSNSIAIQTLGTPIIGDQMEETAYNALPASLSHDIKGLRYYVLPNQPKCTNEKLGFKHNGNKENSISPSPHSGYGCCRSDFHMGWPKFVHNMWMGTSDGGLAIAAYGPNNVSAKLGPGKTPVTITQHTDYPFKSEVTLTVTTEKKTAFPLELRIPSWCSDASITVNKKKEKDIQAGTFHRIERSWKNGDVVKLNFPMTPRVSHWINDSVAIKRGPLAYSLLIKEGEWKSTKEFAGGAFHTYDIQPASPWNYALVLKDPKQPKIKVSVADTMPAQPFKAADAPVRMTLEAITTDVDGWGTFRTDFPARAKEPPKSPMTVKGTAETITLVPYGSTEIRITQFPWTAN